MNESTIILQAAVRLLKKQFHDDDCLFSVSELETIGSSVGTLRKQIDLYRIRNKGKSK